jgi:uracil-DNA glycosylase family 4
MPDFRATKHCSDHCAECPLYQARGVIQQVTTEVHEGETTIMFVAEAPGGQENEQGRPAIGRTGQILRRLVQQLHGSEQGVAYGNVVRCRPTDANNVEHDRKPLPTEIRCCRPNLLRDIDRIKPKFIVLCGDTAAKAVAQRLDGTTIDPAAPLGALRSQEFVVVTPSGLKIPASVTYHFAFVARNPKVGTIWRDDILRAFLRATGKVLDYSQRGKAVLLDTLEKVEKFAARVKRLTKDDLLVLDYENESINRFNNPLLCAGFAFGPDRGYVIPLQHPEAEWRGKEFKRVKQIIIEMLSAPAPYTVVAHNAKFEVLSTRDQLGALITAPLEDTMLRAQALNTDRTRVKKRGGKKELVHAANAMEQAVMDAEEAEVADSIEDLGEDKADGGYGLKAVCKEWLGFHHYDDPDIKPVVEKRDDGRLTEVALPSLAQYNAMDCYVTYRLYRYEEAVAEAERYRKKLRRLGVKLHSKVVDDVAEMEYNGIRIDTDYLQGLLVDESQVMTRVKELEQHIYALDSVKEANRILLSQQYKSKTQGMWSAYGDAWTYEIGKPAHKAVLFFDVLKLTPIRKTAKEKPSMDKAFLAAYTGVEEVDLIAEYTSLSTIKSRYLIGFDKALRESPDMRDGRARANFRPGGTITGRISAAGVNVLNVPKKPEEGETIKASAALIKRMFICDPGNIMVCGDYSQAEVRWLAELTQDPDLIRAFTHMWENRAVCLKDPSPANIYKMGLEGDFHKHTASMIYNVPLDKVTKQQRQFSKAVVFGQLYGQGAAALAAILKTTKAKTEEFIIRFFSRFPTADEMLKEMVRLGFERGYAESLTGRRKKFATKLVAGSLESMRYESDKLRGFKGQEDRIARNMPVQGISSDMNLLACWRIVQYYREHQLPWKLINSVYDSIMLEVPHQDTEHCLRVVQSIMESPDLFQDFGFVPKVKFISEMSVGTHWGNQVDITAGEEKWKLVCRDCKVSREEKQRVTNRRCESCGSTNVRTELVKGPQALVMKWLDRQVKRQAT